MRTVVNSDLYFKIHKIYHINKEGNYVKCKVTYYYKSNDEVCLWLNPGGVPKNYKLIHTVYENFIPWEGK